MSHGTAHERVQNGPLKLPRWGRLLRYVLYGCFWVLARTVTRLRVKWLDADSEAISGGILVGHHKSDLDAIIALPSLLWSPRTGKAAARGVVVSAEQVFAPGFLSGYAVREPRWLSFLLYPLCVSRIMKAMGWYPIAQGRERYLLSHLIDVLENEGDLPLIEVFERPETYLPGTLPGMRIRDVLGWKYRDPLFTMRDFSIFKPAVMDRLQQRHKQRIASSLSFFADTLNNGGIVFVAPHGPAPFDGRLAPFKSGLRQIFQAAQGEVVLIPLNITYDALNRGRVSAFLAMGPFLRASQDWARDRLEQEVRRAILGATTVTLGHLTSYYLRQKALSGECDAPEKEFQAEMREQAKQMAQSGFLVDDRLLNQRSFNRRWHGYISYAIRRGLIRRRDGLLHFDSETVLSGSVSKPEEMKAWMVCANELEALMESRSAELPTTVPGNHFKTSTGA